MKKMICKDCGGEIYKKVQFYRYCPNEKKYLNSNGKEDIRKFIEWLDEKLDNKELKGKNYGILTQKIEKDLNIKIRWRYHMKKKSKFYKLLIARRVDIALNKKKILEVYKY